MRLKDDGRSGWGGWGGWGGWSRWGGWGGVEKEGIDGGIDRSIGRWLPINCRSNCHCLFNGHLALDIGGHYKCPGQCSRTWQQQAETGTKSPSKSNVNHTRSILKECSENQPVNNESLAPCSTRLSHRSRNQVDQWLKYSKMFQNAPKCSKMLKNAQKGSKRLKTNQLRITNATWKRYWHEKEDKVDAGDAAVDQCWLIV